MFNKKIDLRQNENVILRRNENQYCKIKTENKAVLKSWMKILCKNCGFSNIYGKKKSTVKENNNNQYLLNKFVENELTEASAHYKNANFLNSSLRSLQKSYLKPIDTNFTGSKSIAGIVSTSVGSINLLNSKLELLFGNLKQSENKEITEPYLNLEECQSGSKNKCRRNSLKLEMKNISKSESFDGYDCIKREILNGSNSSIFHDINEDTLFKVIVNYLIF